jgi:hypothetical protein
MEQTWEMKPNMEWYVFAEADTYVFWPNLVEWLRTRVNSSEKLYVGSVTWINDFPLAHGGTGYVISGVLLRNLVESNPGVSELYNHKARNECCGDLLLSQALKERAGVKVQHAYPMFNGEKPSTLPYGPGHWCEPIFTMHHMVSEEISAVWQYEQTRKSNVGPHSVEINEAFSYPLSTDIARRAHCLSEICISLSLRRRWLSIDQIGTISLTTSAMETRIQTFNAIWMAH